MLIQRFSLQTMRPVGRHRLLIWPLLGILLLMLQPVQACCTLVDSNITDTHSTSGHHAGPDSHCTTESPDGCQLAISFRIKTGFDDVEPDTASFPHPPSPGRTLARILFRQYLIPPVYPPPWLLTRRLRI